MKLRYLIAFWILVNQSIGYAQNSRDYAERITAGDLKDNLSILASDALEGRETGTRGQKMAAAFISAHFQELGLKAPVDGSYLQPFPLYKLVQGEAYLSTRGTTYKNFEGIVYYGKDNSGGEISLPIVFAGKGRAEDLDQVQVSGKAVLVMLGSEENYRSAISLAKAKKASMVLIVNTESEDDFREYAKQLETFLSDERLSLEKPDISGKSTGVFFVSPAVV